MYETVSSMLGKSENITHPYLTGGDSKKKAIVTITSNRGLAGGYNSNISKLIMNSGFSKEDVIIYAVGTKGRDFLSGKGYYVKEDYSDVINSPQYSDAKTICDTIIQSFAAGEIGEIYLAYTSFKNTVSQEAKLIKLLPVEIEPKKKDSSEKSVPMNYEPNEQEALDMIIPKYITSLFFGAMVESVASENGARMQAMDSATSNAEAMIDDLSLKYNRARQGSITQELTEIIAGAEAIS